ncbi:MAG: hypothetical protein BMS9Abin05_2432 [Rhodothermia bacterium]|nr:MAG: hypothetical protein BMS9Abin05_2432 [Rhodothermia bacterium]
MLPLLLVTAFFSSLAVTLLLVPIVRRLAVKRDWVDMPDLNRKFHNRPTPNVGGLAVASAFGIGLLWLVLLTRLTDTDVSLPGTIVVLGALIMILTGFYDDIKRIGFRRKFLIQVVVAYLLIFAGYELDVAQVFFLEGQEYSRALVTIPITIIWVVGIINAVNLLDGLDGLASGVGIIAFASMAFIFGLNGQDPSLSIVAALMIGVLAGFLVFNFHPASIFMGDSGSLFLGYMLAVFTLQGSASDNSILALLIPLTVLGLPILDTTLCMLRRVLDGRSPFSPDDDHIHHRLSRLLSHRRAVLALYAIAAWFALAAVLMAISSIVSGILIALITLSAAYVGIRTLGYLDLNLPMLHRTGTNGLVDTPPNETELSLNELSLRQHQVHYDAVHNDRTLPVGFAETRGPWRRDMGIFEETEDAAMPIEPSTGSQVKKNSLVFESLLPELDEKSRAPEKTNGATNGSSGVQKNGHGGVQKDGHSSGSGH